ncbi:hypothetical protein GN156_04235 [bacterium LRH843]|nr:hypothetical protein [bacterium LRH843]
MPIKRFIAGIGIGLAFGYLLRPAIEGERMTPERALKEVKKAIAHSHAISGSWIHMLPETIEKNHITYDVYRGGVSTTTEEGTVQFEFLVDMKTGTLIHLESAL